MIGRAGRRIRLATAILPLWPAVVLAGDIYGAVDTDGVMHYTDVPDDCRYRLVLSDPELPRDAPTAQTGRRSGRESRPQKRPFADLIVREARASQLDPLLVHAVIAVESRHNPAAKSPKGALGLMQLMPATAKRYGVDNPWSPEDNIRAGTRYLRDLLSVFSGDLSLALAAYNAGEHAVIRHGYQIPPFAETRAYVPQVLKHYRSLGGQEAESKVVRAPLEKPRVRLYY